ncbi:RloB domain-containing protein [Campylobacter helveticus]|uniref:RloB domain-containing protein n=1 Tax=Campylobacter helveticus TaxID=28898 RepID=A0ABY3L323_9BACT|nr:RloB domain-containing protein [Campylobacter helveticus]MCR2040399.1 RloB family protein [Campylobacter helveticus]MCR2060983.1 RloB family protein [Campylobacter helveticus]MCR2063101.1 RloB family protein [Campylobacter helveticus]MCR2067065.1 RloB family protein [Campylobacter helveticus]TNB54174.1 RloB domain-containing protein [Campylobacter helveticus]
MTNNKPNNVSLEIWCEGESENNYFVGLIEEFKNSYGKNIKIKIKTLSKKSYKNVRILIEKESYVDKVMIVIDLDRANHNEEELRNLKRLISIIKKDRKNKFLFLTYYDFEDWLRFHFIDKTKKSKENLYKKFNQENSSEFKSDTKNIYERIKAKGGSIENAENYFKIQELFCNEDFVINEQNKNKIQSNLYNFRELLKIIFKR